MSVGVDRLDVSVKDAVGHVADESAKIILGIGRNIVDVALEFVPRASWCGDCGVEVGFVLRILVGGTVTKTNFVDYLRFGTIQIATGIDIIATPPVIGRIGLQFNYQGNVEGGETEDFAIEIIGVVLVSIAVCHKGTVIILGVRQHSIAIALGMVNIVFKVSHAITFAVVKGEVRILAVAHPNLPQVCAERLDSDVA